MTNPAQNKTLKLLKFIISIIGILTGGCFSPLESYKTLAECEQAFTPSRRIYPEDNKILTLADARCIALNNNPTLRSSAAAITAAKYNYDRALSAYLPAIDLNGSAGHTSDSGYHLHNPPPGIMKRNDHFNASGSLQATLLLFNGLARELEVRLAKLQYNDRTAADKNVKRLLARAVAYTYWDILLASAELEIAEADVDFQTAALKQSEIQFSSGYVSLDAVLNFK
ncbi:MAG: TolC family protein, partial [Lentisphaeria bacterium]|nr:TolC family protein [Lentisphaeria bacterium]